MTIQFKRITTPGYIPKITDLVPGEIAINIADQNIFTSNGQEIIAIGGSGGGAASYEVQTTDTFTAEKNKGYLCDTSLSAYTVNLPADANNGNSVSIGDYAGNAFNNNITISPGTGQTIMGLSEDFVFDIDYATITLSLVGKDWRIVNGAGESSPPSFISADTVFEGVAGQSDFTPSAPLLFREGAGDIYYNAGRLVPGKGYVINDDGSVTLTDPVTTDEDIVTLRVYNRLAISDITELALQALTVTEDGSGGSNIYFNKADGTPKGVVSSELNEDGDAYVTTFQAFFADGTTGNRCSIYPSGSFRTGSILYVGDPDVNSGAGIIRCAGTSFDQLNLTRVATDTNCNISFGFEPATRSRLYLGYSASSDTSLWISDDPDVSAGGRIVLHNDYQMTQMQEKIAALETRLAALEGA